MTPSFLQYDLWDGYIHNWLLAGPQIISSSGTGALSASNPQALTSSQPEGLGIDTTPVERGEFTVSGPEGVAAKFIWGYRSVEDDHLLDLAGFYAPRCTLRAWAYAELVSRTERRVELVLNAFGPAQLWLNGKSVARQEGFSARLPNAVTCEVDLVAGANGLLVRFEQRTGDVSPYAIAVQVLDTTEGAVSVRLPTLNKKARKHQTVERWAQKAYFERDLYAAEQKLLVKWPGAIRGEHRLLVRVEKPSGHTIGHVERPLEPNVPFSLMDANSAMDGSYQVRVGPEYDEYIRGMVFSRDMDVNLLHSAHIEASPATYEERAKEMLEHVLWWTEGLYSEIAKMALGGWKNLQSGVILQASEVASAHSEGCQEQLLGLLLIAHRYAQHESFPHVLKAPLEACILGYDYARDEVAEDQGLAGDRAIVGYACHILAGQLYPERAFVCSARTGQWHQQRGEEGALTWLSRRAYGGFTAWNSDEAFGAMLPALVALVDYAVSETLGDLAAVIADKLLFSLAAHSSKGVLGAARGATRAASITDGRMQPTSPVSRLLWGMGSWSQHAAAAVGLVGSEQYGAPEILGFVAADQPDEVWAREGHVAVWSGEGPAAVPALNVNIVTYQTPDTMLSSAQDYRPGEPGRDEHIWQATLSPEALVFVNHPVCLSQKNAYQPNFWCGNGVLPRVAQWKDLLVALYRLPDDDWLGYTHAHFPVAAFDEHAIREGWAFARKGEAYLAIKASQGFTLVKTGNSAYRELRSTGQQNVWLCQLGRAAQDGSFSAFQRKVLASSITVAGLHVSGTSLRGDTVAFGWTGPFMVNSVAQPLSGFRHYETPYCVCDYGATEMEIQAAGWMLRLNQEVPAE